MESANGGMGAGMDSGTGGTPGGMQGELRDDARKVTDTAKQRLSAEAETRKGQAASQAKAVSSALGNAAQQLDPNAPGWLRQALEQGAGAIERLAGSVERKDPRELMRDVETMARQNPGAFIAGCAFAGFAAARVFKAGGEPPAPSTGSGSHQPQAPHVYDPGAGSARPEVVLGSGVTPGEVDMRTGGSPAGTTIPGGGL